MSSDEDMPSLSDDSDSDWDEIEENNVPVKCLFCEDVLPSVLFAINHLKQQHDFDLVSLKLKHSMDCYSYIKMINYIQKEKPKPEALLTCENVIWNDDQYLRPTIIDDAWIMFDFEYLIKKNSDECTGGSGDNSLNFPTVELPTRHYEEMKKEIMNLKENIKEKEDYIKMAVEDMNKMKLATQNIIDNISTNTENKSSSNVTSVGSLDVEYDEGYFKSYAHFGIHYEMLSDKVRTESYRDAILKNNTTFDNKIVLDLGCGTGILSMFSAKAGAKHVTAIDMSEIIYHAMDIVRENGLEDKITLLKGRLEDIEIPHKEVDIIVSEWMGYFLLYEGMLDSVIYARDKYLKPGGLLLPNRCNISIVGSGDLEDHKDYINFWKDVYGFNMSCIKKKVLKDSNVDIAREEHLITDPCVMVDINLNTCTVDCVNFTFEFALKAKRDGHLTSFVGYFDTFFDLPNPVQFSTGPYSEPTHWKQTVFYLKEPVVIKEGEVIKGTFCCKRDESYIRGLIISLKVFGQNYEYVM